MAVCANIILLNMKTCNNTKSAMTIIFPSNLRLIIDLCAVRVFYHFNFHFL